jgi:hypothetical protein
MNFINICLFSLWKFYIHKYPNIFFFAGQLKHVVYMIPHIRGFWKKHISWPCLVLNKQQSNGERSRPSMCLYSWMNTSLSWNKDAPYWVLRSAVSEPIFFPFLSMHKSFWFSQIRNTNLFLTIYPEHMFWPGKYILWKPLTFGMKF